MNKEPPKCASCQRFPLMTARDAGGTAECAGWEKQRAWSDTAAACVLYNEVPSDERKGRARIVRELMAAQPKEQNE